jgi:hypothetical protein
MMGVSFAVFVFTFPGLLRPGPLETPYDFQLSQANNIIGHLDMTAEYTHNLQRPRARAVRRPGLLPANQ